MGRSVLIVKLLAFTSFLVLGPARAQQALPDGVYIIFDGSGSMWASILRTAKLIYPLPRPSGFPTGGRPR